MSSNRVHGPLLVYTRCVHPHVQVHLHLDPLLTFAQGILKGQERRFGTFPIFLKATAGMRALRVKQRNVLMTHVRGYFRNASHNPFAFETEYARVISGEEEGAYGWAAINYLAGNLQADSAGSGTRVDACRRRVNLYTSLGCGAK